MYYPLLIIHSWTRWIVLILAIVAIYRSFMGWQGNKSFTRADNQAGAFFVGSIHLQLLLGLLLYFVFSPVTHQALLNMSAAMKNKELRFWAVEHSFVMILAAVLVQVGRISSKRAKKDSNKHKKAFIYFTIAIVLILISIPFASRPIFRF